MSKIRILDDIVANQIAAGEVVERPSSVVKELVENAIDAGGTKVDVTVEDGGLSYIRVVDNGTGMSAEDLNLAFERHATSKIRTGKDLFSIRSLGFRGEALPSIAAVAKVECVSSPGDDGLGRRIVIEGGKRLAFEETAAPRGTDFRVRDLFFNTPARLKYMKTVQTELGHITDFIYRLALSRPDIAFRLQHNGTLLLDAPGNGDLLQAAASIYGPGTAKRMVPLSFETPDYRLSGLLARPEVTRSNRAGMTAVVNGRYVRSYAVAQAILSGYHTLLPINRYPLAILHIAMEPSLVDVNVHPSKLEVRFSKEPELSQAIERAVRDTLRRETLIPEGWSAPGRRTAQAGRPQAVQETLRLYDAGGPKDKATPLGTSSPPAQESARVRESPVMPRTVPQPAAESAQPRSGPSPAAGRSAAERPAAASAAPPDMRKAAERRPFTPKETERLLGAMAPAPAEEADRPRFPELHPIGQLHGTYIVAQNEEGMYLIDQHAAHERIHYELYYEKFGNPDAVSQLTMFSHTIEFTAAEAQTIRERLPLLESVGVYLEPFGGNTFKVRSHPSWFPPGEEAAIIEEMAQWILTERQPDVAKIREASAIMVSCKASIKANQAQSIAALEALLARLAACKNPFTCPHGRPIVVSFTKRDLEKMFKRVM